MIKKPLQNYYVFVFEETESPMASKLDKHRGVTQYIANSMQTCQTKTHLLMPLLSILDLHL